MIWSQYKTLYSNALKTYSPKFKQELQKQVDAFCRTQDINAISDKGLQKTLYSLHLTMGTKMAKNAYNDVKNSVKHNMPNETKGWLNDLWQSTIVRFLQFKDVANWAKEITNTTKEQIQRYVAKGVENGQTINETIKDLQKAGITNYRAELIARTETARAANLGSVIGSMSTGLRTDKIWISTLDNRTRIIPRNKSDHYHMNGVSVPMDEKFEVPTEDAFGFEWMDYPGDSHASALNVCNCRCTIGYKVVKDENNEYVTYDNSPPKGDYGKIWSLLTDKNNNDIYNLIQQALQ